jgi:isocitrate/isopropylmalate dehydrogenase
VGQGRRILKSRFAGSAQKLSLSVRAFPDVRWDKMPVDAMTLGMTLKPRCLMTVVATNRQADVLSDLSGAPASSLGVAPIANDAIPHKR